MQGLRNQSVVPPPSSGSPDEERTGAQDPIGVHGALSLLLYGLARSCLDLVSFYQRLDCVRTSVRYDI